MRMIRSGYRPAAQQVSPIEDLCTGLCFYFRNLHDARYARGAFTRRLLAVVTELNEFQIGSCNLQNPREIRMFSWKGSGEEEVPERSDSRRQFARTQFLEAPWIQKALHLWRVIIEAEPDEADRN
ncbi:MAG: hypothetical protein JO041_03015 [Acidobacteria bacterium]|nr:hypothetical protein [Acidobacteriota bacterium]